MHLFDTVSAYTEARENDYLEPWVSYTMENEEVNYNKSEYEKLLETPLTFEILSGGSLSWSYYGSNNSYLDATKTIQYSKNGGEWTEMPRTLSVAAGDKVQFRGDNAKYADSNYDYNSFKEGTTASFSIKGNIMSLIDSDDFANIKSLSGAYNFCSMFDSCSGLTNASDLILPAETLGNYCYQTMFNGCTSLTSSPQLPTTTLAEGCYESMFRNCTSLTTAPELPATTLAQGCYTGMFRDCTSLTTAPVLPATTLAVVCYSAMFWGCTSLTTAPELPATTLVTDCYSNMFNGCTSLTTAPELPARTLVTNCYSSMFQNCTSLTTAPELPATALIQYCYQNMFNGCTNLNYIKAMFTTRPGTSYTGNWVRGVSSTGTFVKNASATWDVTGVNGIPSGWTVETA